MKITISKKKRLAKLWKKGNFALKDWERRRKWLLIETKVTIGWFKPQLWVLIELSVKEPLSASAIFDVIEIVDIAWWSEIWIFFQ